MSISINWIISQPISNYTVLAISANSTCFPSDPYKPVTSHETHFGRSVHFIYLAWNWGLVIITPESVEADVFYDLFLAQSHLRHLHIWEAFLEFFLWGGLSKGWQLYSIVATNDCFQTGSIEQYSSLKTREGFAGCFGLRAFVNCLQSDDRSEWMADIQNTDDSWW